MLTKYNGKHFNKRTPTNCYYFIEGIYILDHLVGLHYTHSKDTVEPVQSQLLVRSQRNISYY